MQTIIPCDTRGVYVKDNLNFPSPIESIHFPGREQFYGFPWLDTRGSILNLVLKYQNPGYPAVNCHVWIFNCLSFKLHSTTINSNPVCSKERNNSVWVDYSKNISVNKEKQKPLHGNPYTSHNFIHVVQLIYKAGVWMCHVLPWNHPCDTRWNCSGGGRQASTTQWRYP